MALTDTKILYAVETLHIDFVKEPTERKAWHIRTFICGSFSDLSPNCQPDMKRYYNIMQSLIEAKFSPKSITHLKAVAEEIF
jgi:hypothetical protein